jgi:hypothetical protein
MERNVRHCSWRSADTDLSVDVGSSLSVDVGRRMEMPGEKSTINTMTMDFEGGGLFDDDAYK